MFDRSDLSSLYDQAGVYVLVMFTYGVGKVVLSHNCRTLWYTETVSCMQLCQRLEELLTAYPLMTY